MTVTCWQSQLADMIGMEQSMDHTCATSPGLFLVPISDTACSFEPAIAIAVSSLLCFCHPCSRCDSIPRQPCCTQARALDPWLVIVQRQGSLACVVVTRQIPALYVFV